LRLRRLLRRRLLLLLLLRRRLRRRPAESGRHSDLCRGKLGQQDNGGGQPGPCVKAIRHLLFD
jgi:hypothetical protein